MITIAHLYYDLLNLYGESGNVKALKTALENAGIDVTVKLVTTDDTLNFSEYDFVYIGTGTEENQMLALNHLIKYKEDIKKSVNYGNFFLATGNAMELFGKYIINQEGKKIKTLQVFPYTTKLEKFRMVDEVLAHTDLISTPVLGFQNQFGVIKDSKFPIFNMKRGIGSYPNSKTEGYHQYNFFGTYFIGPLLIRNPELLQYLCKELCKNKQIKLKNKDFKLNLETKAHEHFLKNYYPDEIKLHK